MIYFGNELSFNLMFFFKLWYASLGHGKLSNLMVWMSLTSEICDTGTFSVGLPILNFRNTLIISEYSETCL